jgi:hypothetical protein
MIVRVSKLCEEFGLASLWQRIIAEIIDWIICRVLVSITAFFLFVFLNLNFTVSLNEADLGSKFAAIILF